LLKDTKSDLSKHEAELKSASD
jgi:hypothetical protein